MKSTTLAIRTLIIALGIVGACGVGPAKAVNLLQNPSFEADGYSHTIPTSWTRFAPPIVQSFGNYWNEVSGQLNGTTVIAHSGSCFWKEWGASYDGTNNVAGIYQTFSSNPGSTYQASAWLYINSGDELGADCYTWVQVEFLDSSSNLLALYKSDNFNINAGLDRWINYSVTNACDITQPVSVGDPFFNTYAITGAVSQLTAPAGTTLIRFRYCYLQSVNEGGSSYMDDADLEQLGSPVPPTITSQPQSVTVSAYSNTLFSVSATGMAPLIYQWTFNGTNIPGATAGTLIITNVTQCNLGAYAVTISNSLGSVTSSNAVLSMYPFLVTPFAGLVTDWGFTNTLSVDAWGTGPLSYQWYDNGVAVPNATNSTFTLSSIQFTNAGLYSVVVNSPLGSATNTPEQVVVDPAGVSLALYPGVTVSGVVGYTYEIQASSDLTNTNGWTTVATLTLTEPQQLWVDINATAGSPQKFYRVVPGQ